jgi:hypothetical protein
MNEVNEMPDDNPQDPIDPQLTEYLNRLRPTPDRKPEVVEQNQKKFLAQLDSMPFPALPDTPWQRLLEAFGLLKAHHSIMEVLKMSTRNLSHGSRIAISILALLVVAFTLLFGGSAVTVLASQSAIPGDALYGLKTTVEKTRITLATSAAARADLQLRFGERRLEETKSLVEDGRFQNIKPATEQFEAHINNALAELELIAKSDPTQATALLNRITNMLMQYADLLDEMMNSIPEPVKADLQNTVKNLRDMSGNENGNLNENGNANGNSNVNQNSNDNLNDNHNDNTNVNDNTDVNNNTNVNDNTNVNVNTNTNDDDDDFNTNGDDDDSNNNDSGGGNTNDDDDSNNNESGGGNNNDSGGGNDNDSGGGNDNDDDDDDDDDD